MGVSVLHVPVVDVRLTTQDELEQAMVGWVNACDEYTQVKLECEAFVHTNKSIPPHELGYRFCVTRQAVVDAYDRLDSAACGQTAQTMRHNALAFTRSSDFLEDYPADALAEVIAHLHTKVRAARLGK